jgi:hypothetical protein
MERPFVNSINWPVTTGNRFASSNQNSNEKGIPQTAKAAATQDVITKSYDIDDKGGKV